MTSVHALISRAGPSSVRLMCALFLLILVLAAFADSFSGGFVGDSGALVQDPRVQAVTRENLARIFTENYWYPTSDSAVYRPLVTLTWLLNYRVLGNRERTAGYHVLNLLLHLVNVWLAWLLAESLWKSPLPALATAAVFAIHPVNTEAVTNVAGRADLMAALGVLAALVLHVRTSAGEPRSRQLAWAGMFAGCLFGVFSKENAIALPAAMLLYDLVFRRADLRRLAGNYLAVAPGIAALLVARQVLLGIWRTPDIPYLDNPLAGADFWTARLTAVEVLWRYLGLLVWPQKLSWDYAYNQIPMAAPAVGLAALGGILALLGFLLWMLSRRPLVTFFGFFFFLTLGPTSNLLLLIGSIMAERFLYLPSIGFAGCLAAAILAAARLAPAETRQLVGAGVLALLLAALGWRTWNRNLDWTDGERLWSSTAEISSNSYRAVLAPLYAMGSKGYNLGNIDTAIAMAERSVAIVDGLPPERNATTPIATLASLYLAKADLSIYAQPADVPVLAHKAVETLHKGVAIDKVYSQRRVDVELARGWPRDRIVFKANGLLYQYLAEAWRRLGKFPESLEACRHLALIQPDDPGVHAVSADLERILKRPEDSIVALWQAMIVGGTRTAGQLDTRLAEAYAAFDPGGCAITAAGRPNLDCPLVRKHRCAAYRKLVETFVEAGRRDQSLPYAAERDRACAAN